MPSPYRVAFFGTPSFAVPTFTCLLKDPQFSLGVVITQPDRPSGRGKNLGSSPIKECAQRASLPLLQPQSVRRESQSILERLKELGPFDGAVVVAFGQIISPEILSFFRGKVVNIHGSLLPLLRGAAPLQRSLIEGFSKTGVSIMKLEEGLDTGPVYSTYETTLSAEWRYSELHDHLAHEGALLLTETLSSILDDSLLPVPQNNALATYAAKLKKDDGLINWAQTSTKINNLIRGTWPFPGAFTFFEGKRLKIARSTLCASIFSDTPPGTLVSIEEHGLVVSCLDSSLTLQEVIPEGKKLMSAFAFALGHGILSGKQFSARDL